MTEQATPPPATDPPKGDDDDAMWKRLGDEIDKRVDGALARFFPPDDEGASASGSDGSTGNGEPPKRGTGGDGAASDKAKAKPPSEAGGGNAPAKRKGGFLERLLYG